MFNTIRTGTRMILLAVLTAFTQSAAALGLGNISVESYLNQPLRAKIDLITRADDDLGTVTVDMASADDFALIGASREAISVPLGFALEQNDAGASILVTSKLPVKDPVIRLIVEVKWANGRLLREYTLFLDPPSFTASAPSPVVDERGRPPVSPAPAKAEWVQAETATQRAGSSAQSQAADTARSASAGNQYGPVQSGDTLWRIATDWSRGTGLDLNAVMLEIQRNNPQAFINDNINLLKRGAILRLPQVDEVRRLSAEAARAEVRQQNRMYSQRTSQPAVETPLLDPNSRRPLSAEAGVSGAAPEDQLELVPPADNVDVDRANGFEESLAESDASTAVQALRAELARKEEELIVEQQQNQYLQDQIAELQTRLQPGQDGNVADAELSQMEAQLRKERLSEDSTESAAVPASEPPQTEPKPAEQPRQAAVPQVTTSVAAKPVKPWYSSLMMWLLALLVLAAAVAGWLLNRRHSGYIGELDIPAQKGGTVRKIKDEAEEILKVLKTDKEAAIGDKSEEAISALPAIEEPQAKPRVDMRWQPEEAELLDEDSADPEVRLDLARAYISMGDREAARVILAEVMEQGFEEQQAEARKMLDKL